MSDLSELFGTMQEDGQEPDFDAIFGGEASDAPPIPAEEPKTIERVENQPEPETTQMPEVSKSTADKPTKNAEKAKSKKPTPEPEPNLFSAFNQQEDETPPAPNVEGAAISLFDKPAVFS